MSSKAEAALAALQSREAKETPPDTEDAKPRRGRIRRHRDRRRVLCPECAADMRVYSTKPEGKIRIRYYKCGFCGATEKTGERIPQEEIDAAYQAGLADREREATKLSAASADARTAAREAVAAARAAAAAYQAALADLKEFREEAEL